MRLSSHSFRPWWILALWLALAPFWIQKESLWIDEAVSAIVTLSPSLGGVWSEISRIHATEMHLPAYHYYLWLVARGWGHHEAILRAANLPWMLLGFVSLILAIRTRSASKADCWMALFLVTNPFLFYYANEVRPYAMQFGLASLAFAGITRIWSGPDHAGNLWSWMMAWGTVLLAWTTIYGLAWWVLNLFVWMRASNPKSRTRTAVTTFLVTGGLAAILFHGWVILMGAKASAVGATNLKSLAYAVCEWTGSSGFLPGRSLLRAGTTPGMQACLEALVVLGLTVSLWLAGLRNSLAIPGQSWWPFAWSLPGWGILASGIWRSFRVVGRHFTPIAPSFFWFLSLGPRDAPPRHWTRWVGATLLVLWIWSDVRLATLPEHRKDDYRAAAHYVQNNRRPGETTWWAADDAAARFYGIQPFTPVPNLTRESLASLPPPDWVVLSKPDIYDGQGALRDFLDRKRATPVATYQAFVIYRLP